MIAEVIPESKTWTKSEIFSYSVPENLTDNIKIGSLVNISFGRKQIRGVVEKLNDADTKTKYKIKEIISVADDFVLPENYIEITKWISRYYLCSLGDAISLFLPPQLIKPRPNSNSEIRTPNSDSAVRLSPTQQKIFDDLKNKLDIRNKKPALIHGVTGSGKTEIYIKLTEETLKLNKQIIILVPEIMLTPQTVERFEAVFGDKICLQHSNRSEIRRLAFVRFSNAEN